MSPWILPVGAQGLPKEKRSEDLLEEIED